MTVQEFLSSCFEIRVNAHINHLQNSSFAQHKALDELYTELQDLQDSFTESYQGQYNIVTEYPQIKIIEMDNIVPYLLLKVKLFKGFREELTEGYLQNQLDTIIELLYSTIYKLKHLA